LLFCFALPVFADFFDLKISPYQRKEKKCLSQKKTLFFFSTSRRIKHALKTRNTRHYLDLKYTFLIHTYFK
jgi:hypothetical protein